MRKKLVSLLLCMTTSAMLLAGCGASAGTAGTADKAADTATSGGDETGASTAAADSKAAQAVAERKAEAEKSGEYQKVVISFFDWTGRPAGLDRINAALSAHTEETLGLDVELQILDSAAYSDDMKLMLSSGEQVDIFNTCILGYSTCINNGYVLDLEEDNMFADYCTGIQEKVREDYIDACRVGGVLYGVPPIKDYAIETCAVCIGQEYLDGIGYDVSKLPTSDLGYPKATWDDINDIYAQLHEKYPDKYVMATQDNILTQGSSVDNVGGDYYGTLLDPMNSLKVENVYTSDIFKD